MTEQDVVAELDRWIVGVEPTTPYAPPVLQPVLQRARDEIVALRELVADEADRSQEFADHIRAEALEEAAQEAAALGDRASAHAIRALKERGDDAV